MVFIYCREMCPLAGLSTRGKCPICRQKVQHLSLCAPGHSDRVISTLLSQFC